MLRLVSLLMLFFFSWCANASSVREELIDDAMKLCIAPNQYGENFNIEGEGKIDGSFKIIGGDLSGKVKKEEADGIREILKEHQASENKNYRDCALKIVEMFLPQMQPKETLTIDDIPCFSEDIKLSNNDEIKKVMGCLQRMISEIKDKEKLPMPEGSDNINKNGVSVVFNGCENSDNYKYYDCHLNIYSESEVSIEMYNDKHTYRPYFIDKNNKSMGADCISINGADCNYAEIKKFNLLSNIPISIMYRHKSLKSDLKSYYVRVGFKGKVYGYEFIAD